KPNETSPISAGPGPWGRRKYVSESERLKTPFTKDICSDFDGPPASVRFLRGRLAGSRSVPPRPEPENVYVSRTTSSAAGRALSTRTCAESSSAASAAGAANAANAAAGRREGRPTPHSRP